MAHTTVNRFAVRLPQSYDVVADVVVAEALKLLSSADNRKE
ncbi:MULTISPECIES: hypothetical protein [Mycolicibacterium]|jgi:hypothetical protein|uniref:Uncharacterized protein n=1 Tax=Mycolicibacterium chlorophenolicum TaxID=37916 RepID=A0A0J6VZA9_9MYCO|nr:hypothetical protein [Mycolicibacterium chlorophenolicum]KMO74757.1 hypothetical protein MCHLDSM_03706 [Mycolicibacterium chlorophenolicum]